MTACPNTSPGVPMALRIAGARRMPAAVRMIPAPIAIAIVVWTAFLTPSLSRAPKNWEMTTPAPADAPMQNQRNGKKQYLPPNFFMLFFLCKYLSLRFASFEAKKDFQKM